MTMLALETAQDEFNFLRVRCSRLKLQLKGHVPPQTLGILAVGSLTLTAAAFAWAAYKLPTGLLPFSVKKHLEQLIKYSRT